MLAVSRGVRHQRLNIGGFVDSSGNDRIAVDAVYLRYAVLQYTLPRRVSFQTGRNRQMVKIANIRDL